MPLPKPIILAHRGDLRGPDRATENTVDAYSEALEAGFCLEIDVRREPSGTFYISHDPVPARPGLALDLFEPHFRAHPGRTVAVNVKELGYEPALAELVLTGTFGNDAFLFDFELLEPVMPGRAQRLIRSIPTCAGVRLASRLSDRDEPLEQALAIPGEVVWADEFDAFWLTEEHVRAVHQAKRLFFVVSPELHGFPKTACLRRWADLKSWGVDGICTDFALEARAFFGT